MDSNIKFSRSKNADKDESKPRKGQISSPKLRQAFLSFFEKKGHKIVPSSSLIPTDPSCLLTTAGMQQFKPYYLGKNSPFGQNVASCQKCFRTSDIEEVGDESHLTFIEMLGNFSFSRELAKGENEALASSPGGYFKEEAIKLAYEFLFKELKLPLERATFTVFEGDRDVPADEESVKIWKSLGIREDKIKRCGREDNFWGPTGEEGPCGPTTEIHIGGVELWNLVFNEYYCDRNKNLSPLKQKGVDTGMGLERLAMISQKKESVFETDLFYPIFKEIPGKDEKAQRIIADHIKGAVFLIGEGILPSNLERGYILRRILRRAIRYAKLLGLEKNFLIPLAKEAVQIYKGVYPELGSQQAEIITVIQNETEKFEKTLERGIKQFEKLVAQGDISGESAFHLFDTFGFPLELTQELAQERKVKVDTKGFEQAFKTHQQVSRAGREGKFGGVGKEAGTEAVRLHTATHLLHAALRKVLGEHVKQMGSDITSQRLRFDFSHPQKMTEKKLKQVEDLVNKKIKEDLEVKREEMSYQEALDFGALAFFQEKYPERVSVFSIDGFSREICAGPHVKRTSELGEFQITKEESSGSGVRRIRAVLK